MNLFITFCVWLVCVILMWFGSAIVAILLSFGYTDKDGDCPRTQVQLGLAHLIMCIVSAFLLISILISNGVL